VAESRQFVSADFAGYEIVKIKYCTARVIPRPHDPQVHVRQEAYLRALKTLRNVEIIFGTFLSHTVKMPSAANPRQMVEVIKTEEKGSDVNLASHLLFDACQDSYELGIVISDDSDLVEPIRLIRKHLGKKVGVLSPGNRRGSELRKFSSFHKPLTQEALKHAQFPHALIDSVGRFHKPKGW
jgi:hypothetical protein